MRWSIHAFALVAIGTTLPAPKPAPTDWIDPSTGHRIVRLTDDAGGSTLYFHDNSFSPALNHRSWSRRSATTATSPVAREKLVDMARHDSVTGRGGVEPNVHITPDKKWIIFTGQFAQGQRHVYAVSIAKRNP